jgi:hypothetical protein
LNKRIGIISKVEANHGSCIFDRSLTALLEKNLPDSNVEFVIYPFCRTRLFEFFRTMKINKQIPFYNLQRQIRLNQYSSCTINKLNMAAFPTYDGIMNRLEKENFDVIIPSKVVWDITNEYRLPHFPNFYYPSEKLITQKFAYAVSGHRTDLMLFRQFLDKVRVKLAPYKMIGVRDDMTQVMMEESGVGKIVPVTRITDPAFLYAAQAIDLQKLLERLKIKQDRPWAGLLFFGKPQFSKAVVDYYHARGYQTINFSMFNPFADINVGHLVDPDEWVTLFKTLSFCITDRFHGTVFCLREGIPFVSIEPFKPKTLLNSKIFSLLKEFDLIDPCYQDPYNARFTISEFLDTCENLEINWSREFSRKIHHQVLEKNEQQNEFMKKICAEILTKE